MNKIKLIGVCLGILLLIPTSSYANIGFGVKAGTLGVGVEVTKSVSRSFSARLGVNRYTFEDTSTEAGITYDMDLNLESGGLLLDWHPFGMGLRATAGVYLNNNEFDLTSTPATNTVIGGVSYTPGQIGTLSTKIEFDDVVPYFGVGWGHAAKEDNNLSLSIDLGVLFQGAPEATMSASGGAVALVDIAAEEAELNTSLEDFEFYPVLSIGLAIQF